MRKYAAGLLAFACAAACQVVSDPPKKIMAQDVEFLRGCWVSKAGPDGPATAFLRLLPEDAGAAAYQGYLQTVEGGETKARLYLSFTRDGVTMTMRQADGRSGAPSGEPEGMVRAHAPMPAGLASKLPRVKHRAGYATRTDDPALPWFIAEGNGDTLKVYPVSGEGEEMRAFFNGQRDGCD